LARPLPVDAILPELCDAVRSHGAAVVVAPPGSGKTTRVPGALLDAGLAGDGKVVVLQPRRVAARATARWIASERGGRLGDEVGYSVRFERRTSRRTRLEIVTEGLLTRRLQADPFLDGVGCVVLDEFHERSLHADLALALLAEVQRDARPDLRIVVMSATLAAEPVAAFLSGAPIVRSDGRVHPVDVEHAPIPAHTRIEDHLATTIRRCLGEMNRGERADGDLLCFLPGAAAIRRVGERLGGRVDAAILPLHGSLPPAEQDRALQPHPKRKVVLATNVAETSLTIDGVTCVVDSGRVRAPELDPISGLTRLVERRASMASVRQRGGRAGRTRAGTCVRAWSVPEERGLRAFDPPSIATVDLTETVLQVRAWGADPATFAWFEPPSPAELSRCDDVLRAVEALDDSGLTDRGRRLAGLPVHPRVGAVLLAGAASGRLTEAATLAALVQQGDIYKRSPPVRGDDDIGVRMAALGGGRDASRQGVEPGRRARVVQVRDALLRAARGLPTGREKPEKSSGGFAGLALAGFADRVARLREGSEDRYQLVGGRGGRLSERSVVRGHPLIVALALRAGSRGEGAEHTIDLACAIDPAMLRTERRLHVRFDIERDTVIATRQAVYRDLVIGEHPAPCPPAAAAEALERAARAAPDRAFEPDRAATSLLARLRWLAEVMPELDLPTFEALRAPSEPPDADAETTLDDQLLAAACAGRRSFAALRKVDLSSLISGLLDHRARTALSRHAPTRITLPAGRSAAIRYGEGPAPILAARIQHLFGLRETPRLAGGRVPVLVHLLAPNGRPAQVTQDLESFWKTTYTDVRKQLRGRYPKHAWPEKPV